MEVSRILLSVMLAVLLMIPLAGAVSITRSLSPSQVPPGGDVAVTLTVDVTDAPAPFYAIDEMYPQGFNVTDSGAGSAEHVGHWKTVVIEGAKNVDYTYVMTAPEQEGTYSFSGEYMFGNMEAPVPIAGQDTILVTSETSVIPTGPYVPVAEAVIGIIIVAVIVAFVMFRKKMI
jgi:hypothetical protein